MNSERNVVFSALILLLFGDIQSNNAFCFISDGVTDGALLQPRKFSSARPKPPTPTRQSRQLLRRQRFLRLQTADTRTKDEKETFGIEASVDDPSRGTPRIHLLSFNFLKKAKDRRGSANDADAESMVPKTIDELRELYVDPAREVRRWRDGVLGSTQELFEPRPRTLAKLQNILIDSSSDEDGGQTSLLECSVLSNCARLVVLCVTNESITDDFVRHHVTRVLLSQARHFAKHHSSDHTERKRRRICLRDDAGIQYDKPHLVVPIAEGCEMVQPSGVTSSMMWTHLTDQRELLQHLFVIAGGMQVSNPNCDHKRARPFLPHDCGDAHVMNQLKKTMNVVSTCENGAGSMLKTVYKAALRAGKGVRNAEVVPEILALKQQHADESTKKEVENNARRAAMEKVIWPEVEICLRDLMSNQNSHQIQQFRQAVLGWAETAEEEAWLRKALHLPTLELRQAESQLDRDTTLAAMYTDLKTQLDEHRTEATVLLSGTSLQQQGCVNAPAAKETSRATLSDIG